jgi:drug/metabolite transporter (DMT)-like permease
VTDPGVASVGRSIRRWVALVAVGLALVGVAFIGLEVTPTEGPVWAVLALAGAGIALAALLRTVVPVQSPETGE